MKPKKTAAVASRDEEWVPSRMGEAEINRMVEAGVFLIESPPDGDRASVSPSPCLIPTKWWYLRIIFGAGCDFLFIHS